MLRTTRQDFICSRHQLVTRATGKFSRFQESLNTPSLFIENLCIGTAIERLVSSISESIAIRISAEFQYC